MLLMIHGIAQQDYIGKQDELRKKWVELLRKALVDRSASKTLIDTILNDAVMLFYADITDPKRIHEGANTRAAGVRNYENLIREGIESKDRAVQNWWLAHLMAKWGDQYPGIRDRLIKLFAAEAYGYFEREEAPSEVDSRCDETIGDRKFKLILSHSFGTVVGYRVLSRKPSVAEHFITMGSPLGTPFMMRGLKVKSTPNFKSLKSWDDFADPDDIVSYLPIDINDLFDKYSPPPTFSANRKIVNATRNEHSIQGYINQPAVVDRILQIYG